MRLRGEQNETDYSPARLGRMLFARVLELRAEVDPAVHVDVDGDVEVG